MPAKYNHGRNTGIHLVSSSPQARPVKTRLTAGDYIADIVVGAGSEPSCYYVVQRVGSADIIELERYDTFEHAREAAEKSLARWSRSDELRRRAS